MLIKSILEDFWNKKGVQDFIIEVEGILKIVPKKIQNVFQIWDMIILSIKVLSIRQSILLYNYYK